MKGMRVAMVNKYYPPHLGGIEFHLRCLAEALVRLQSVYVEVIVSNASGRLSRERVHDVDICRLPSWGECCSMPLTRSLVRTLRHLSRNGRPDLIHLHAPFPLGELSWILARTGVPTVLTYHSDIVRQKTALRLYKPFLLQVLRSVEMIIATSPNMIEHSPFLSRFSEKCRVVPFGIDVDRFIADRDTLRRVKEIRLEHSRPIVLCIGRLVYYKGVDVLIKAMKDVSADLVIIGNGPLEAKLSQLARDCGIGGRTSFLGRQPFRDLVAWYHAADVFCLPSTARSESFGLVQLEAQATGTPVVSTRLTTGVPFANQHGRTGLVVEPDDPVALGRALQKLLSTDSLRRDLGQRAMERAREYFTTERMVADTLAVYEEALALGNKRNLSRGAHA